MVCPAKTTDIILPAKEIIEANGGPERASRSD
jgi:hypothetical protein